MEFYDGAAAGAGGSGDAVDSNAAPNHLQSDLIGLSIIFM